MYIDPSSGGQLAQILIIAFGAISGSVLVFAGRIRLFVAKLRRSMREQGEAQADLEHSTASKE